MKRISHFLFSRSQRSGIFFFGTLVVVLQFLIWKGVFEPKERQEIEGDATAERIEQYLDSMKLEASRTKYTPRPFNPNYMSDHRGYLFGMTPLQIDRLFAYREAGKFVTTAAEFQAVTGIHDSLLAAMAPYFDFPRFPAQSKKASLPGKADINLATEADLQKVYGVGPVLAERIVAYRARLGGFQMADQLTEVYGLEAEVVAEIWRSFQLGEVPAFPKQNINDAGLDDLASVPYISRALASKIIAYRSVHNRIDSLEELTKFHNLSEKDLGRIQLYLKVE